MKNILSLIIIIFVFTSCISQQNIIKQILNKEIIVDNNWAGESYKLIHTNNNYKVLFWFRCPSCLGY